MEYINHLFTLHKESQFTPFWVEWLPLYGVERRRDFIIDDYTKDLEKETREGLVAGERFQDLLDRLLPTIEKYPYVWPLEGKSLDPEGYDFSMEKKKHLEIERVAYQEAIRLLGIPPKTPSRFLDYNESERVTAPHLTKLQLTLEKSSPLTTLSFQFFSKNKVKLVSLISERDLSGGSSPQNINLAYLQVQQNEEEITLLFEKPVLTKRLTFVLAQENANTNKYHVNRIGEDFSYTPVDADYNYLKDMVSHYHHLSFVTDDVYSNEEIKDWSDERKTAYQKWRNEQMRRGAHG